MALRTLRIGAIADGHQFDDAVYSDAIETDCPIAAGAPVNANHVLRLGDVSTYFFPVGGLYLSTLSTNPAFLLGFGTWVLVAQGQFLVGYKSGDADFGTAMGTGGSKTHTHDTNIPSTTSSGPSGTTEVDNNLDSSTVDVASAAHTHDVDPASITSGNNSALPPFYVIYIWRRTT